MLSESRVDEIINESINNVILESKTSELTMEIIKAVLSDEKLLNNAIKWLSPRFNNYDKGTFKQKLSWRLNDFISETPEIFKGIMSIVLRKKVAKALYDVLSQKYGNYFK